MNHISGPFIRAFLLLASLAMAGGCARQNITPNHDDAAFQAFAETLLAAAPAGPKIAIRPFAAGESPIPLADANRFNASLEQAIRERFPGRFRFVPRAELQQIAADAEEFGQIGDFNEYVRHQQADILIFGHLEPMGEGVLLGYRSASPATGQLLEKTATRLLGYRLRRPAPLALEPALALLADRLTAGGMSLQRLYKGGIFYEESGIQPPLGQYLMQRLDTLVEQRLSRRPAHSADDYLEAEKRGELPERHAVLGGQYWVFEERIELRAFLKGPGIRRIQQVQIEIGSVPERLRNRARPPLARPGENDHLGPNPLYLSSDRGRRPLYRVGDRMRLTLQAGEGGHLYCFDTYFRNGERIITRIFPNRYHQDPYIPPRYALQLPDDSMDFVFTLHPPAGPEYVRCYLFDRDVTRQLPAEIVERDLAPLALDSMEELDAIMRGIPDTRLTQATLALTVEGP